MRVVTRGVWLCAAVFALGSPSDARAAANPRVTDPAAADTAFDARTKGHERRTGLLTTWLERKSGRLLLELPRPAGPRQVCGEFLYLEAIRTGLGSNPVGLDRGQGGETRLVQFRRVGGRVMLEQPNLRYRARSADSSETRAVRESFAVSVLWAAEVLAERADGRLLVDLTPFLVRDAHGVAAALKAAGQGAFALDKERSTLDPDACRSFPDNLEFGALLTFASEEPGPEVRATAPTPQAITLEAHHSLVRLPDDGYRPRAFDPRSGSFEVMFADYAQPVAAELDVRWLVRHRLEKLDPSASRSRVKRPIVFYVDSGTPEPIRSALVDGASWWAKAFEAAGFIDAYQVKLLPPDVDPLDVRYHVIQWVHRATRGWSYGGGIIDPRTGEMLKGSVTLGSLRIRQDRMLFEGFLGTEQSGKGGPEDPVELSLARIRQLAAHEVGHTLGLMHNFAASASGHGGSVMDYPAPRIKLRTDGTFDFTEVYGTGLGEWDVQAIRFAYAEFASPREEQAGLEAILRENRERGLRYLSDDDTRPAGAAHPYAAMWDHGEDPVAMLAQTLAVRRAGLERFGERSLAMGTPLSTLNAVLVPLYFHHRYQLEAAAKSIGGLEYQYSVRGDGAPPVRPVSAAQQRAALAAVLAALDPAMLDLPESLLGMLPPPAMSYPAHREFFGSQTAPAFDALGAAATAADLAVAALLPPERLARLVDFHRRDASMPGVEEVLDALVRRVFDTMPANDRQRAIARSVQAATVRRLIIAAGLPAQTPAVRAALESTIERLAGDLSRSARRGAAADRAPHGSLARDLARFLTRPAQSVVAQATGALPLIPPGPPIGSGWAMDDCEWRALGP